MMLDSTLEKARAELYAEAAAYDQLMETEGYKLLKEYCVFRQDVLFKKVGKGARTFDESFELNYIAGQIKGMAIVFDRIRDRCKARDKDRKRAEDEARTQGTV